MKSIYTKLSLAIFSLILLQLNAIAQTSDGNYDNYKPLLIKNASKLGITPADAADAVITNAYTDTGTQITYVYVQQAYQQVKVYNIIVSAAFRNGSFLYASGDFVKEIASKAGDAMPKKTYLEATRAAANHLQLNAAATMTVVNTLVATPNKYLIAAPQIAKKDIETSLYWTASDDKTTVTLTWNVNIDVLGSPDWWNVRIDANTGEFVQKDNWTVYENNQTPSIMPKSNQQILLPPNPATINPIKNKNENITAAAPLVLLNAPPPSVTNATYNVIPFPIESPNFGSPTVVSNPWLMAGAGNNAITDGWHYDGTTNYNITRGNNVFAFLDVSNNNTPDAANNWPDTSTTASPTLTFNKTPIFTQEPSTSTNNVNKKFALDNLFYWNNLMHDVFYQYGFTEPAGNFQNDNLSRGGTGADYVEANAQDGKGTNNANFATPVDGQKGRMQMYLFTTSTPQKDGDIDNGVITHEYGHGISTRLTGGPANSSCLNNAEEGGEGWSDYFALMMTTDWTKAALTDGTKVRPIGTYVENQAPTGAGIRRHPYTTDLTINPITYANMAASTEVHNIGEIWCSALWDMTWSLIQQQNSITTNLYNSAGTGGNSIAINLVLTGLKLQPCSPGFLDARNAILAADSILYNYAHKCAIWSAFARRGMGASAIQGSSTSATDQTAAFDVPSSISAIKPVPLAMSAGAQNTFTHTATCGCQALNSYLVKDTIPTGFTYVSSTPTGTLNGNVLSFPATNFAANETKNFSIVLKSPATGCAIDTVINDNRETNTVGGFANSGGTLNWATSTARANSGTSSWYASEPTTISQSILASANTAAAASKNLSIFSFNHYFNTENNYDGGVVEYSTNNGTTWTDAAPFFFNNGTYNTVMDASTVLTGRTAFSGSNQAFRPATLNVSSFGTTPVSFRFRMTSDNGTGGDGWFVDDILRINGCGAMLKTGYYTSAGVRQDTALTPLFITPATVLPLTLLWFYANQVGSQAQLNWKTTAEINVKDFTIEWSTNGANWTTVGSAIAQNGNTNNYDFMHASPAQGNNFYRIKMNDADGHFTYSPTRTITMQDKQKPMLVLIPNPVSSDAVLYISKDLNASQVNIYNAIGALVRQTTIGTGAQQVQLSTAGLPAGIYTIGTNGTIHEVVKMVVVH